ncbi:hypothetical protein ACH4U7_38555, partial [Streptomyces sp. NPDC020845]
MTVYQPPTALPRELLNHAEMRAAIVAHDFGAVFSLARDLAKISYSKIAAECDIKPERVGTLARGQGRISSFQKIATIADALRIPGHLLGLAPREWEAVSPSEWAVRKAMSVSGWGWAQGRWWRFRRLLLPGE